MTLFDGAGARAFLGEHWQHSPAFFRAALTAIPTGIPWRDLARDEAVESRRVRTTADGEYRLDHGPFDAAVLDDSSSSPWTVLIQDADQHVPALRVLLEAFDFLPRWRLEDIMLSFASDGGSVGPHTDQYDVFLVQAEGKRRWTVGDSGASRLHEDESGLRLVAPFEPLLDVVATPGDVLYLPPGVPHHGVARGPCVTYSVGFRAPGLGELAAALLEECDPTPRYRDPGLAGAENPALIDESSIARALALLQTGLPLNSDGAARCLGRLVTEPKDWLYPQAPDQAYESDALAVVFARGDTRLACCHTTRIAFTRSPSLLFVNGEVFTLGDDTADLAATLAGMRALDATSLRACAQRPATVDLLARLLNLGAVYCNNER